MGGCAPSVKSSGMCCGQAGPAAGTPLHRGIGSNKAGGGGRMLDLSRDVLELIFKKKNCPQEAAEFDRGVAEQRYNAVLTPRTHPRPPSRRAAWRSLRRSASTRRSSLRRARPGGAEETIAPARHSRSQPPRRWTPPAVGPHRWRGRCSRRRRAARGPWGCSAGEVQACRHTSAAGVLCRASCWKYHWRGRTFIRPGWQVPLPTAKKRCSWPELKLTYNERLSAPHNARRHVLQ